VRRFRLDGPVCTAHTKPGPRRSRSSMRCVVTPEYNHSTSGRAQECVRLSVPRGNDKARVLSAYGGMSGAAGGRAPAIDHGRDQIATCARKSVVAFYRFRKLLHVQTALIRERRSRDAQRPHPMGSAAADHATQSTSEGHITSTKRFPHDRIPPRQSSAHTPDRAPTFGDRHGHHPL